MHLESIEMYYNEIVEMMAWFGEGAKRTVARVCGRGLARGEGGA